MRKTAAIEALIAQRKIIDAVQQLRAMFETLSLGDAKRLVDRFAASGTWPAWVTQEPEPEPEPQPRPEVASDVASSPAHGALAAAASALIARDRYGAILALRPLTGWSMLQAKKAADHYLREGTWSPEVYQALGLPVPDPGSQRASPVSLPGLVETLAQRPGVLWVAVARRGGLDGALVLDHEHCSMFICGMPDPVPCVREDLDTVAGVEIDPEDPRTLVVQIFQAPQPDTAPQGEPKKDPGPPILRFELDPADAAEGLLWLRGLIAGPRTPSP